MRPDYGGLGYTDGSPCLLPRDVRRERIGGGTDEIMIYVACVTPDSEKTIRTSKRSYRIGLIRPTALRHQAE